MMDAFDSIPPRNVHTSLPLHSYLVNLKSTAFQAQLFRNVLRLYRIGKSRIENLFRLFSIFPIIRERLERLRRELFPSISPNSPPDEVPAEEPKRPPPPEVATPPDEPKADDCCGCELPNNEGRAACPNTELPDVFWA